MMYMNEWDIEEAIRFFDSPDTPNLSRGSLVLGNLMDWTNRNSDGWPYWQRPSRAAARLMDVLELSKRAYRRGETVKDISDADLRDLCKPIKAFLTRNGADHEEVFK